MNNLSVRLFLTAALVCGVFFLVNCSGTTTTTGGNNTAVVVNKPADSPKTTDAPKTETADKIGVPECDEFISKYEACLTKIAKDAPQVQPSLKSSFEQTRNGYKQAASNPQSKATLASTCKQQLETTKQTLATYKCEW